MKSIETEGKTVDQAIEIGLYKLGLTRDQVKISILEEAGLFTKAKVRLATMDASPIETEIKNKVEELLSNLNLNCDVFVEEQEENFIVDITGEDAAIVIGKRGDTLDAFQTLINSFINDKKPSEERKRIKVDSNNYRGRREDTLKILAQRMAAKAVRENRNVKLDPMNAYERRIIHNALNDHTKVETESSGNEPNRYVVIKLKNRPDKRKEKSLERKAEETEDISTDSEKRPYND